MDILYTMSYDRKAELDEPLAAIIQILWNNKVKIIHRYAASTLEFIISGANENEIGEKAIKILSEINKIAYVRLTKACDEIVGTGNDKLDGSLEEFIKFNINAGLLKRVN